MVTVATDKTDVELQSQCSDDTRKIGVALGLAARAGQVFALDGDLGSGKTTLAKGIGQGLETLEPVTSPSFPIMNVYQARLTIYHFDFYRLEVGADWHELGLDEFFYAQGVSIIEWPDRIPDYLPEQAIRVYLRRTDTTRETNRRISIRAPEVRDFDLQQLVAALPATFTGRNG